MVDYGSQIWNKSDSEKPKILEAVTTHSWRLELARFFFQTKTPTLGFIEGA